MTTAQLKDAKANAKNAIMCARGACDLLKRIEYVYRDDPDMRNQINLLIVDCDTLAVNIKTILERIK